MRQTGDREDVRSVPAACSLDVEGRDAATADRPDGVLDEACLVERVRVQRDLQPPLLRRPQRGVDGRRGGARPPPPPPPPPPARRQCPRGWSPSPRAPCNRRRRRGPVPRGPASTPCCPCRGAAG